MIQHCKVSKSKQGLRQLHSVWCSCSSRCRACWEFPLLPQDTLPGSYHCPLGPISHHPDPKESADSRSCDYKTSTSGTASSNSVHESWRRECYCPQWVKLLRLGTTGESPLRETWALSALLWLTNATLFPLACSSLQPSSFCSELEHTSKFQLRHWIPILAVHQNQLKSISNIGLCLDYIQSLTCLRPLSWASAIIGTPWLHKLSHLSTL